MTRRRLAKQVAAYRDGALSAGQAERMRRLVQSDPEARTELARNEALGRLTRDAWCEGPGAPSPEQLIALLRPGLARIDAELGDAPRSRWREWLAPLPIAALGTATAAVLALAVLRDEPRPFAEGRRAAAAPTRVPAPAAGRSAAPVPVEAVADAKAQAQEELPVYDLAQGDSPLILFEEGGTTFIWLIDPERARDDLSAVPVGGGLV